MLEVRALEAEPLPAPVPLRAITTLEPLSAAEELALEREATASAVAELADRLWRSTSLAEQGEVLEQLERRLGLDAQLQGPNGAEAVKLCDLLEEVYRRALAESNWSEVRRMAGALGLVHPQLEDALIDLLVRQKQVVVGRNYTNDSLITEPMGSQAIATMIRRFSSEDCRSGCSSQPSSRALRACRA